MRQLKGIILKSFTAITILYMFFSIFDEWRGLSRMHYIGYDYAFFYYAFQDVIHHQTSWNSLYNIYLQQKFIRQNHFPSDPYNQYVYPPQFAWIFSWCGLFPFWLSAAIWMSACGFLYFWGIFLLVKTIWLRIRRIHLLAVFVVAAILSPFQIDIAVGNVNSMLFAAISLTFYLQYYRNKPKLAGIPLGIVILLKVTPAAILLVFVLRKQWVICKSTIITVIVGSILSSLFVGVNPIIQYIIHFSTFGDTSMKNGPAPYNQSIIGVLGLFNQHHLFHLSSSLQFIFYLVTSIAALWGILRVIRQSHSSNWRLDIALASLMPIAFSPLVEEPHMLFVIPSLLVFAYIAKRVIALNPRSNLRLIVIPGAITIISIMIQSLPATFLINHIVEQRPQWFFIHIQMFLVLFLSFITTLWLYSQTSRWAQ